MPIDPHQLAMSLLRSKSVRDAETQGFASVEIVGNSVRIRVAEAYGGGFISPTSNMDFDLNDVDGIKNALAELEARRLSSGFRGGSILGDLGKFIPGSNVQINQARLGRSRGFLQFQAFENRLANQGYTIATQMIDVNAERGLESLQNLLTGNRAGDMVRPDDLGDQLYGFVTTSNSDNIRVTQIFDPNGKALTMNQIAQQIGATSYVGRPRNYRDENVANLLDLLGKTSKRAKSLVNTLAGNFEASAPTLTAGKGLGSPTGLKVGVIDPSTVLKMAQNQFGYVSTQADADLRYIESLLDGQSFLMPSDRQSGSGLESPNEKLVRYINTSLDEQFNVLEPELNAHEASLFQDRRNRLINLIERKGVGLKTHNVRLNNALFEDLRDTSSNEALKKLGRSLKGDMSTNISASFGSLERIANDDQMDPFTRAIAKIMLDQKGKIDILTSVDNLKDEAGFADSGVPRFSGSVSPYVDDKSVRVNYPAMAGSPQFFGDELMDESTKRAKNEIRALKESIEQTGRLTDSYADVLRNIIDASDDLDRYYQGDELSAARKAVEEARAIYTAHMAGLKIGSVGGLDVRALNSYRDYLFGSAGSKPRLIIAGATRAKFVPDSYAAFTIGKSAFARKHGVHSEQAQTQANTPTLYRGQVERGHIVYSSRDQQFFISTHDRDKMRHFLKITGGSDFDDKMAVTLYHDTKGDQIKAAIFRDPSARGEAFIANMDIEDDLVVKQMRSRVDDKILDLQFLISDIEAGLRQPPPNYEGLTNPSLDDLRNRLNQLTQDRDVLRISPTRFRRNIPSGTSYTARTNLIDARRAHLHEIAERVLYSAAKTNLATVAQNVYDLTTGQQLRVKSAGESGRRLVQGTDFSDELVPNSSAGPASGTLGDLVEEIVQGIRQSEDALFMGEEVNYFSAVDDFLSSISGNNVTANQRGAYRFLLGTGGFEVIGDHVIGVTDTQGNVRRLPTTGREKLVDLKTAGQDLPDLKKKVRARIDEGIETFAHAIVGRAEVMGSIADDERLPLSAFGPSGHGKTGHLTPELYNQLNKKVQELAEDRLRTLPTDKTNTLLEQLKLNGLLAVLSDEETDMSTLGRLRNLQEKRESEVDSLIDTMAKNKVVQTFVDDRHEEIAKNMLDEFEFQSANLDREALGLDDGVNLNKSLIDSDIENFNRKVFQQAEILATTDSIDRYEALKKVVLGVESVISTSDKYKDFKFLLDADEGFDKTIATSLKEISRMAYLEELLKQQSIVNTLRTGASVSSQNRGVIQQVSSRFSPGEIRAQRELKQLIRGHKREVRRVMRNTSFAGGAGGAGTATGGAQPTAARAPVDTDLKTGLKRLWQNDVFRKGFYGVAAVAAASMIYQGSKDKSPEDMAGPEFLPGGSPYENYNMTSGVDYPSYDGFGNSTGTSYSIQASGSYDPGMLAQAAERITGVGASGTINFRQPTFVDMDSAIENGF